MPSLPIYAAARLDCAPDGMEVQNVGPTLNKVEALWTGVLLERHGRHEQAVEVWRRYGVAQFFMSAAILQNDSYQDMQRWAKLALGLEPDNWRLNYLYGILLLRYDVKEAEKAFLASIALNPKQNESYLELGLLKYEQKAYADAERWCARSTEVKPQEVGAWNCLAYSAYQLEHWQAAESALEQGLALKPDTTYSLLLMGRIDRKLGNVDQAEIWLRRAVAAAKPRESDWAALAWYELGNIYLRSGRQQTALDAFRHTLQLDAQFPQAEEVNALIAGLEGRQ